jgi:multiple sugar transport system permease protein
MPYAILILVPYFAAFPSELEDAARIDGCTRFGAFVRMVLPLSAPGLAACGVIMFVISWHELLIPLIVTSKPEFMTVPVVLAGLVSDSFVFFTLMMAICLLGLLPTLVLVLVLQKHVVRGLVSGVLKG